MKKLAFELKKRMDNGDDRLVIVKNQSFDEEELVSEIIPIFHRVNPSLDDMTGQLRRGLSFGQCFETGPRWILAQPDSEGIRHRIGISVHPRLLDQLITEMNLIGYQINYDALENPSLNKKLGSSRI